VYVAGWCDGTLHAFDATSGATVWTVSASGTAPVLANGVLYHGAAGGVLVARDPASGAQLWSDFSTPGRSANGYLSVALANGAVYAARDTGIVTAHHP
jgi:outer membrane protein assembly factor BamB